LERGELVYPVGENAEAFGLKPGVGINFPMIYSHWDGVPYGSLSGEGDPEAAEEGGM
jgi:hypothetical protein